MEEMRKTGGGWAPARTLIDDFIQSAERPQANLIREAVDPATQLKTLTPTTELAERAAEITEVRQFARESSGTQFTSEQAKDLASPKNRSILNEVAIQQDANSTSKILEKSDKEIEDILNIQVITPGQLSTITASTDSKLFKQLLSNNNITKEQHDLIRKTAVESADRVKADIEKLGGQMTDAEYKTHLRKSIKSDISKILPCD